MFLILYDASIGDRYITCWYYQTNRRRTPINADMLPENLCSSVFICGLIKFTNTNCNGLGWPGLKRIGVKISEVL